MSEVCDYCKKIKLDYGAPNYFSIWGGTFMCNHCINHLLNNLTEHQRKIFSDINYGRKNY